MTNYVIPVIAGDGIGPEIVAEGKKVMAAAGQRFGFCLEWLDLPYGAEHYLRTGELLPDQALAELARHRAMYLGAVGDPRVEPGLLEMGIVLAIRFHFDQYVNLRPVVLFEGIRSPLAAGLDKPVDIALIRENTEDFYIGQGGRVNQGSSRRKLSLERSSFRLDMDLEIRLSQGEVAYNLGLISRAGAERVIRYGFELARNTGRQKVTLIDKANVLPQMYGLWREAAAAVASDYPELTLEHVFADAATMWLVKNPERFQVVVAPNLFGDVLSDLGAAVCGGLGLFPGGNINPDGVSMFEPMHGSAPKYRGLNAANPLATVWAGAMLLDFLGEKEAARAILAAMSGLIKEGLTLTPDLGGKATTSQVGDALARRILDGR
ncbi:MAG: isocitrate/isopropylmalate dehydrogenase family protein [Thermodesulfobacteriota bacterium]